MTGRKGLTCMSLESLQKWTKNVVLKIIVDEKFPNLPKDKNYRFKKPSKPKQENLKKKIHTQTDHSQTSENKLLKAKYLKAAREKQHIGE